MKMLKIGFILIIILGFLGCASTGTSTKNIPSESKFAKLQNSMTKQKVYDLIGPPKDVTSIISGKTFNPFYFGTDINHTVLYYEGEGRIVFNQKDILIKVIYDPNEDGLQ